MQQPKALCSSSSRDCDWYHGNWPTLKALGIVSSSAIHEREFRLLIADAIRETLRPRILISGSTDQELLRMINDVCVEQGKDFYVDAVDICETPLSWISQYAISNGMSVKTYQSDILEFTPPDQYDLVVTHAFLGYFDAEARARLIEQWASFLARQGKVVTIQRIRNNDDSPGGRVFFREDESLAFIDGAIKAALSPSSHVSSDEARRAAEAFAANFSIYPIRSSQELVDLFVDHGFCLKQCFFQDHPAIGRMSGPSVPSKGNYAFVLAEKVEDEK